MVHFEDEANTRKTEAELQAMKLMM